eukprot:79889_1
MGRLLTLTFTLITSVCAVLLLSSFIHFACAVNKKKQGKSVDSLVKKCAFVSLFGYTTFVILSLVLYLIQSLYYIPSTQINYSTLICQMQTFNIVFFMTGKLAMYIYFLSLVHVAFRGSFLAYPVKLIFFIGICFFFLMCTIGAFYMVFLYIDFSSVGPINSPADCDKFEASKFSTITIWTGATCDAIWSFTCLSLFYLRLRKLTKLMKKQHKLERKETDDMLERIKLKRSSKSLNDLDLNTHRNIIVITGDKTDGEKHVQTDDENIIQSGLPTVNELNDDDECALSIAPDGMQTIDNDIDIDIDIDIKPEQINKPKSGYNYHRDGHRDRIRSRSRSPSHIRPSNRIINNNNNNNTNNNNNNDNNNNNNGYYSHKQQSPIIGSIMRDRDRHYR